MLIFEADFDTMMKKIVLVLLLVCAALGASAATFGPLTIHDWHISGLKPTSLKSLDGSLALDLTNTGGKYTLTGISGTIYTKSGDTFLIGTADSIIIPKGRSTVTVKGHGGLSSYSALLSFLRNPSFKPADYTADIVVTVKKGVGKPHTVTMSRVPLSKFLK